ncbi:amino acid adenylation domain-containing protein [Kordia sp.]|uniref:non-ribosomal peptide synthetase n=1 Tax=Kordia sp. TaxID=1965332 RepID=UPI003B5BB44B
MKELIAEIQSHDIQIAVVDGELELSFEGDTIDAELIEKIRHNKQNLINLLEKHNFDNSTNELVPVAIQKNYPLSNAQKRLWMVCQMSENSKAYNIPNFELLPAIDVTLFKKAIASVIERHEILRTVFKEDENGEIRQWILTPETLNFNVNFVDCTGEKSPKNYAESHIREDQYIIFDLEKGPLLRATLYKIDADACIVYFNMHHIISDAISMRVFINDAMKYYTAFIKQEIPQFAPLQIHYKDYAVWQQNQQKLPIYEKHKLYWLNRFEGEIPVLNLQNNKMRPKMLTNNGKHLHMYIDAAKMQNLYTYVDKNGGTPFIALLTIWNVLLAKYTSQTDIILGASVSGRDHADLEDQIGFYIESMPLRTKIDLDDSFDEFYEKVKENTLSDFVHNKYPFDVLVEDLELTKDLSRNALFDIMLTLDNEANVPVKIDQESVEIIHEIVQGSSLAKFDLDVELREVYGGYLSFNIVYNKDIYEEEFIRQLMKHFSQILDVLIHNSSAKLANITYLTDAEKAHIISDFNNTVCETVSGKNITTLFAEQVENNPEAKALEFEDKQLDYKTLDDKSNQFAYYLKEQFEIDTNDKVAVSLPRNEYLLIASLAVLKLGATFIPIDANYPQGRKDYIIKDSEAKVNIDNDFLSNYLEKESTLSVSKISNNIKDTDVAYIIYTSGTTGQPKGVMISHKAFQNYIQFAGNEYMQGDRLRCLLFTSISFDLTITTLFTPICFGGSIKIIPSKEHVLEEIELIQNDDFDLIKLTPSHIKVLLEVVPEVTLANDSLAKRFIVGGEALSRETVKSLYKHYGDKVTIWNEYGPTEATVGCIVKKVEKDNEDIAVGIGKPITNMKAYILDASLQIVPIGVEGELYISGTQLANGYLNQAELTSRVFMPNPFKENEIIYKTGDYAKWLSDGNITYLGRKDDQVKIRGNRIELGEIEKHLCSKEEIEEATIIVRNNHEQKELVAYIKVTETQDVTTLRDYLSSRLPQYMIPNYFVTLAQIPLTINGKIDVKALPIPTDLQMASGTEYVAPQNEIEEKLVALWEEALHKNKIGVNDNFFHLGGDSIRGIRIISKIKKRYDVKISLRSFFQNPTIKSLAEDIANNLWQKEDTSEDAVDSIMI